MQDAGYALPRTPLLGSSVSALQDRRKVSRIGPIDVDHERALKQLKQVVPAHHQALGELEGALLRFEESISSSGENTTLRPREDEQRGDMQLPSTL